MEIEIYTEHRQYICNKVNKIKNKILFGLRGHTCGLISADVEEILNPFQKNNLNKDGKFGNRRCVADEFLEKFSSEDKSGKVFIITGKSGIGKSTFIDDYIMDGLTDRYHVILIREYNNLSDKILSHLGLGNVVVDLDPFAVAKDYLINSNKPVVFILDQIERLINKMEMDMINYEIDENKNISYINKFISFLNDIIKLNNVSLFIACRSEYLHKITSDSVIFPNDVDFICNKYITYSLKGIDITSDSEITRLLENKYKSAMNYIDSTFKSRLSVNPLYLKVACYASKISKENILGKNIDELALLIIREQSRCARLRKDIGDISLETIFSILYAVAVINKITGDAASVNSVAKISKVPVEFINKIVDTFVKFGLLRIIDIDGGKNLIRISHDLFLDAICNNDLFNINPYLKDAINTAAAKIGKGFGPKIKEWSRFCKPELNIGFISILIFYIFYSINSIYIISANYGIKIFDYQQLIESAVKNVIVFNSGNYNATSYIIVGFMHCLWVTYIYYMDKNYISYITTNKFLLFVSGFMPMMGTLLGIYAAINMDYFIIPVMVVGFVYAVIMIMIGISSKIPISSKVSQRGRHSMLLMTILFFIQFYIVPMIGSSAIFGVDIKIIISIILIYYWFAMWQEHQREHMLATWVANHYKELLLKSKLMPQEDT